MVTSRVAEMVVLSLSQFVSRFNEVRAGVDLRTLLVNVKVIQGICHPTI
jgi:hypothetical protein